MSNNLTRDELARALGYHNKTLERWEINGVGPRCIKVGSITAYRTTDVEQWVRTRLIGQKSVRGSDSVSPR